MKQHLAVRPHHVALLFVGALAISAFVMPKLVEAQSAPEKIRLMADALRIRDSGDLVGAKEKAEELIKIVPSDQNVQRLLASINRDLDRASSSSSTEGPVFGQAPAVTVDQVMEPAPAADELFEEVLSDKNAQIAESVDGTDPASDFEKDKTNPYELTIEDVSPEFVAQNKIILDLLTRGRAQFIDGDYDGAQATFREVEARDTNNAEAKLFQTKIASILGGIHSQEPLQNS